MYERQAEEIFALVQNSIPALPMTASTTIVVKEAIKVVRELENSRASILAQMQTFAKSLPEYSLAPIVLWGLVIAIIHPFVPLEWFWVVYCLQIVNMSGAAGDLFVTIKFYGFPKDILIRDYGVGMTVFSKE